MLLRGARPWRVVLRTRLVLALRGASRERRRQPIRLSADLVLRARAVRAEMAAAGHLLSTHLGSYDAGPLTDVGRAAAALGALRNLQDSLGQRLVPSRLAALLSADALTAGEASAPARTLVAAITAWQADAERISGHQAGTCTAPELAAWAQETGEALDQLAEGLAAVESLGVRPATLRELANYLLAREWIDKFSDRPAPDTAPMPTTLAEALGRTGTSPTDAADPSTTTTTATRPTTPGATS